MQRKTVLQLDMEALHKKLVTYAYNLLGSYADAKDAVQDVYERYELVRTTVVDNPVAYLTRSVFN